MGAHFKRMNALKNLILFDHITVVGRPAYKH